MIRLFVYGTLKRGFALHAAGLTGQRLVGIYRTVVGYPMMVAGLWFTPMMLNEPAEDCECMVNFTRWKPTG
jgi:gamma-glutamylaminecyclotransferase